AAILGPGFERVRRGALAGGALGDDRIEQRAEARILEMLAAQRDGKIIKPAVIKQRPRAKQAFRRARGEDRVRASHALTLELEAGTWIAECEECISSASREIGGVGFLSMRESSHALEGCGVCAPPAVDSLGKNS